MTIYGKVPSKSNCYRIITIPGPFKNGVRQPGHSSLAKKDELKKYERNFERQLTGLHRKLLQCKITARMTVYYENARPDLDNAFKVIFDCLQKGGVIANDRLINRIIATRGVDKSNPRVEIELTEFVADDVQLLFPPTVADIDAWLSANAPARIRKAIMEKI